MLVLAEEADSRRDVLRHRRLNDKHYVYDRVFGEGSTQVRNIFYFLPESAAVAVGYFCNLLRQRRLNDKHHMYNTSACMKKQHTSSSCLLLPST